MTVLDPWEPVCGVGQVEPSLELGRLWRYVLVRSSLRDGQALQLNKLFARFLIKNHIISLFTNYGTPTVKMLYFIE